MESTPSSSVSVRYIQSATSSGEVTSKNLNEKSQEATPSSGLFPLKNQENLQEEILISPTRILTPVQTVPVKYDFFNPRVIGVFLGLIFLWLYVKGLRKGK